MTALAAAFVGVSVASADIDTTPAWNGSQPVAPFGPSPNTGTYGQTVTGTGEALTGFTVQINGPSSIAFQGGVGVWDGSKVTSVLWSGPDQQTGGSGGFEPISFELPDGVELAAGQAYVLYATTLNSSGSGSSSWGVVDGGTYAGGEFVFQNGGSLFAGWDGNWAFYDLAFQARFGNLGHVVFLPVPARGGYCTVAGNTDPYTGAALAPGTFVNLAQEQVTSDPSYAGVVPAIYVEGKGLTCDPPPAGYTQHGLAGDDQKVGSGLYPYYT
ncbi:MAG: hypothetical protein WB684_07075, partial [Gaiella sp.]